MIIVKIVLFGCLITLLTGCKTAGLELKLKEGYIGNPKVADMPILEAL